MGSGALRSTLPCADPTAGTPPLGSTRAQERNRSPGREALEVRFFVKSQSRRGHENRSHFVSSAIESATPRHEAGCRCASRVRSGLCVIAQELNEQCAHQFRLLLLHPVSGAIEKMETGHTRAGAIAHLVDCTRSLIDAPI